MELHLHFCHQKYATNLTDFDQNRIRNKDAGAVAVAGAAWNNERLYFVYGICKLAEATFFSSTNTWQETELCVLLIGIDESPNRRTTRSATVQQHTHCIPCTQMNEGILSISKCVQQSGKSLFHLIDTFKL